MIAQSYQQEDLDTALYQADRSLADVRAALTQFAAEGGRLLRGATVFAPGSLEDAVSQITATDLKVHKVKSNPDGDVWVLELSREWGRKRKQREHGMLLVVPSASSQVYHLFTSSDGGFWRNVVGRLLTNRYPRLSHASLTTNEVMGLLSEFVEHLGVSEDDFRVTEMTHRSRLVDQRARRQQETNRGWTDHNLADATDVLKELDASIERVRFEVYQNSERACAGSLARTAEFTFAGNSDAFFSIVLTKCARIAETRFTKLAGRERREETGFEARPFFIEYDGEVLQSPAARKRLVGALRRMKNVSLSVIHGNPYVHVSLLDYLEDTSCEIYVMSPSRITLVPQTRSTETSLERVYAHISREFGEGRLVDFSEVYTK